jgi:hypothetical protein
VATWARIVPCCALEALPVVIDRLRCPRCGTEHADETGAWREVAAVAAAPLPAGPASPVEPRGVRDVPLRPLDDAVPA